MNDALKPDFQQRSTSLSPPAQPKAPWTTALISKNPLSGEYVRTSQTLTKSPKFHQCLKATLDRSSSSSSGIDGSAPLTLRPDSMRVGYERKTNHTSVSMSKEEGTFLQAYALRPYRGACNVRPNDRR